jgi:hypothetical protein
MPGRGGKGAAWAGESGTECNQGLQFLNPARLMLDAGELQFI